ncbi:MAG: glycosyltransferase family 9 protein [Deltaproteobacteria bacterium]|nr:glycosyltransferase family 9 protein [Deltaproteobacteria bacterium]
MLPMIPGWPLPVGDFLKGGKKFPGDTLKVCLMNGGGGGLGDGIMFGSALEILTGKLLAQVCGNVVLDVYSSLPTRTHAVLRGIPSVRVKALPITIWDYLQYDAQVDCSGMLQDVKFQTAHMTDFVLDRMGMDPGTISDEEKEPVLRLAGRRNPTITVALAQVRKQAQGRRMVAVIFSSARVRTMPDPQAASLIRFLSETCQPVVIMPPHCHSGLFLEQYNLADSVIDLSMVSRGFSEYMSLLAGMDAIVSVDTSAVHIGGALRKPTVGIFNSINKLYRIRYSPTVVGIQLEYRGKGCTAPCGRSKGAAFVQGNVPGGDSVRLEFGYACDEAVDKDLLLNQVIEQLQQIDPASDSDSQVNRIYSHFREKFISHYPPCWNEVRNEAVAAALEEAFRLTDTLCPPFICPVCQKNESHRPCDRWRGIFRYRCQTCGVDFFRIEDWTDACGAANDPLPLPTQTECGLFHDLLVQARPETCLWIGTGRNDWDREWWPAEGVMNVDHFTLFDCPPVREESYDCVIAPGVLDVHPDPLPFFNGLVRSLRNDGLLVLVAMNRNCLENEVDDQSGSARTYLPGPGWQSELLQRFCQELGTEILWSGVTTLEWEDLTGALGRMTPLIVNPPDLRNVRIQLTGEELSWPFRTYLKPALDVINQGRYCLAVARKLVR